MRDLCLTEEQTKPYSGVRREAPAEERRSAFRLMLDRLGLRRYRAQAPVHPFRELKP